MNTGCEFETSNQRQAIVVGDSMAPTLWGEHDALQCQACGFPFRLSTSAKAAAESVETKTNEFARARCPNCGSRSISRAKSERQPADRVSVLPGKLSEYARWQVVATEPTASEPAFVKRILGLPGETIRFLHGDVLVDNKLVRKSPAVARQMRIPVYDSQFVASDSPPQLRIDPASKAWTAGRSFTFDGNVSDAANECLRFHPRRCVATKLATNQPVTLEDWYATNTLVSRSLNPTNDFWIAITFEFSSACRFSIELNLDHQTHVLDFDFAQNQATHQGNSHPLPRVDASSQTSDRNMAHVIEVITFDRRVIAWLNGKEVVRFNLQVSGERGYSTVPFLIRGHSPKLTIHRLQLWRDIHYFDVMADRTVSGAPELRTGVGEFLLLGDNVPVSIDSRHWPQPAVHGSRLLGRVIGQKATDP